MMLVGMGIMIGWFLVSLFIVNFFYKNAAIRGWINDPLERPVLRKFIILALASLPIAPDILLHYYQKMTLPFVCDNQGGYQPNSPVKLTSIINWEDPYEYLVLPNVEFTEWERVEGGRKGNSEWNQGFPPDKYRFRYFPSGSEECIELSYLHRNLDSHIEALRLKYSENGYPLKPVTDECIGVEYIDEFSAIYQIRGGGFFRGGNIKSVEDSGFGYSIEKNSRQLVNPNSNAIVRSFNVIYAKSPMPFFSLFSPSSALSIGCKGLFKDRQIDVYATGMSRTLAEEYGFFDFSEDNN